MNKKKYFTDLNSFFFFYPPQCTLRVIQLLLVHTERWSGALALTNRHFRLYVFLKIDFYHGGYIEFQRYFCR